MAKISGVLTDGVGNIINNCTIELYAKKTTSKVLTQTQAFQVANNGSYTMNVLPCDYDVKLIINGFPPKKLGTIQVFSDSKDGTLNDFLLNPLESEITPAILQQVIDARNYANKSAEKAADSERNSKTSETNAKVSADNARASENNAFNSAQSASESATTAHQQNHMQIVLAHQRQSHVTQLNNLVIAQMRLKCRKTTLKHLNKMLKNQQMMLKIGRLLSIIQILSKNQVKKASQLMAL